MTAGAGATAVRIGWEDVDPSVRAAIEDRLGATVVDAVNQPGGYSPGLAARCGLADGRRVFIKAVSAEQNPDSPAMHRREARVSAALPPQFPTPRVLFSLETGPWVAIGFEEVSGRPPAIPWNRDELTLVVDAVERLAEMSDPSPVSTTPLRESCRTTFNGWRRLAGGPLPPVLDPWSAEHLDRLAAVEASWEHHADGTALVHLDIRSDNVLITGDGAVLFVDWAHATIGPSWLDLLLMLPAVTLEGGPEPSALWMATDASRRADPDAATAFVVALAGYFTDRARHPPPANIPNVRAFQAAQGEVAREWVRQRTGWR